MRLSILRGDSALDAAFDDAFAAQWTELQDNCVWATAFQSLGFVRTWYRHFIDASEPFLLCGYEDGRLVGVLALAKERATTIIHVAGGDMAEYQSWLVLPQLATRFMQLLSECFVELQIETLTLTYLPPELPEEHCLPSAFPDHDVKHLSTPQPLVSLTDETLWQRFRKRSNQSRIRRLRRLGQLGLTVSLSGRDPPADISDACALINARAVQAGRDPPLREVDVAFLVDLSINSNLLCTSFLLLGAEPISAHIDFVTKTTIHLGFIGHDARLSRQSPGKVHFMLLWNWLLKHGFVRYDMTPDGAYKFRFATHMAHAGTFEVRRRRTNPTDIRTSLPRLRLP